MVNVQIVKRYANKNQTVPFIDFVKPATDLPLLANHLTRKGSRSSIDAKIAANLLIKRRMALIILAVKTADETNKTGVSRPKLLVNVKTAVDLSSNTQTARTIRFVEHASIIKLSEKQSYSPAVFAVAKKPSM